MRYRDADNQDRPASEHKNPGVMEESFPKHAVVKQLFEIVEADKGFLGR